MIYLKPSQWTGSYALPKASDVRWRAFGLLFFYLLLGIFFLGFDRKPIQIFTLIAAGAVLDLVLNGVFKKRKVFPLSAMISCCSLAILLNWSYAFHNLWIPVFICITSKYLISYKGRHFFNPSLFAIVCSILFLDDLITLAPSYQWYGSAATASLMIWFIVTGALVLFVFKIKRNWLIASFLIVFTLQTIYRANVMEHIIPWETLWLSSLTSPAFYLFTFYMITDPATSPKGKWDQIFVGASIGILDLLFHLKLSYYTFFFAGITVAAVRFIYFIAKDLYHQFQQKELSIGSYFQALYKQMIPRYAVVFLLAVPVLFAFRSHHFSGNTTVLKSFSLEKLSSEYTGLAHEKSDVLKEADPRVAHVAKWVVSVGDAAASADVDLDGDQDVFLTQILKSQDWRGKLHINKGNFQFEKRSIPALEKYLGDPKKHGLPGFAFFLDYDNDGDEDLFVGFGFGKSHLFENLIIPSGSLKFVETNVPYFQNENTVCLSANALDFNRDGRLDFFLANTLHDYLPDYETKTPLNIFDLPQAEYDGDRRMFHFLHESWHNADNGGINHLFLNTGEEDIFAPVDTEVSGLKETRWSLATGTADFNHDGWTDIYVANDFGRDDFYINKEGKGFERIEGSFYGDIGKDTYKGMNVSVGDLDNNGKEDIYISNVHHEMQAEGSLLWMNYSEEGGLRPKMVEEATRRNALNTHRFGWGAAFGDLNLDGYKDIIQTNGMVGDKWDKLYDERVDFWYYQAQIARTGPEIHSYADKWADIRGACIYEDERDRIMLSHEGDYFVDYADDLGFVHEENTRGICLTDLDNDGDKDILVTNQFGETQVYKNNVTGKQWLGIRLEGNGLQTNRNAVGTKVYLHYEQKGSQKQQMEEQRLVSGFMAAGDTRLLFGLGEDPIENMYLEIEWHNATKERIDLKEWNQYLTIRQK